MNASDSRKFAKRLEELAGRLRSGGDLEKVVADVIHTTNDMLNALHRGKYEKT